jgi:hypothetical protein
MKRKVIFCETALLKPYLSTWVFLIMILHFKEYRVIVFITAALSRLSSQSIRVGIHKQTGAWYRVSLGMSSVKLWTHAKSLVHLVSDVRWVRRRSALVNLTIWFVITDAIYYKRGQKCRPPSPVPHVIYFASSGVHSDGVNSAIDWNNTISSWCP